MSESEAKLSLASECGCHSVAIDVSTVGKDGVVDRGVLCSGLGSSLSMSSRHTGPGGAEGQGAASGVQPQAGSIERRGALFTYIVSHVQSQHSVAIIANAEGEGQSSLISAAALQL